jgi:hypothetical protein
MELFPLVAIWFVGIVSAFLTASFITFIGKFKIVRVKEVHVEEVNFINLPPNVVPLFRDREELENARCRLKARSRL